MKKTVLKNHLLLLLVLMLVLSVCGCSSEQTEVLDTAEEQSSDNLDSNVSSDEYLNYTYQEFAIDAICKEYEENPLRVESYVDQYVTFTGYEDILYEGANWPEEFAVVATVNSEDAIICHFASDSMSLTGPNRDEKITIWGKMVSVGGEKKFEVEVLHYSHAEPLAKEDIVYEPITANELIDAYEDDYESAEMEYYQKYVAITGPITEIESDCILFEKTNGNSVVFPSCYIRCEFTEDEQKKIIADKNPMDVVTVKGRIANMMVVDTGMLGMIPFYSVDIYAIE